MKVPGALWTAIFIVLSMLPAYLSDTFAGAEWLPALVGAILIVLKVWEVYKPADAVEPPDGVSASAAPVAEDSKITRLLLG